MDEMDRDETDRTGQRSGPTGLAGRFERLVVEDAPAEVLDRIVTQFRARAQQTATSGFATRLAARIRATLAFDDWVAGPALALRGVATTPSGPRHLVYAVDAPGGPAEVAISLYPLDGARVTIVGQVLSDADAAHLVDVVVGDRSVATATSSEHGEFTVEAPAEWDEIVLAGPDLDVVIAREVVDGDGGSEGSGLR